MYERIRADEEAVLLYGLLDRRLREDLESDPNDTDTSAETRRADQHKTLKAKGYQHNSVIRGKTKRIGKMIKNEGMSHDLNSILVSQMPNYII